MFILLKLDEIDSLSQCYWWYMFIFIETRWNRQSMLLTVDVFDTWCFRSWCFGCRCSRTRCFWGAPYISYVTQEICFLKACFLFNIWIHIPKILFYVFELIDRQKGEKTVILIALTLINSPESVASKSWMMEL